VENEKIIKSFNLKPNLNPEIWENYKYPNKAELKNEIRTRLLEIANEFIDFVEVDIIVTDIILMGSLVNYNWSEYSDFDLHILSDLSQYSDEKKELYLQLFDLKKTIFNYQHDIKIKGFDVELYLQNDSEIGFSEGVYSILNNEFISVPKKTETKINKELIIQKSKQWMDIIDGAIESVEDNDFESGVKILKKYYRKLKKYRQCGLESGGEFSIENLVFKYLRRNGYVGKLLDYRNKFMDKKLSMQEYTTKF
jgi:hypothetical protein